MTEIIRVFRVIRVEILHNMPSSGRSDRASLRIVFRTFADIRLEYYGLENPHIQLFRKPYAHSTNGMCRNGKCATFVGTHGSCVRMSNPCVSMLPKRTHRPCVPTKSISTQPHRSPFSTPRTTERNPPDHGKEGAQERKGGRRRTERRGRKTTKGRAVQARPFELQ